MNLVQNIYMMVEMYYNNKYIYNNYMNKYYNYTFKNGLQILLVPNNIKIINFNLNIKIGNDIEEKNNLEISHFLEHLMALYTSSKYPCANKNREFFSYNNINIEAETFNKHIIFRIECQCKHLEIVCDYIINSLLDFKIDKNVFNNEKNSVIEELNEIIKDTDYNFETKINTILYKNYTREYTQEQRLKNTIKLTIQDIYTFYNKYINSKNMVISFIGWFDKTKLLRILKQLDTNRFIGNHVNYKLIKSRKNDNIIFYKTNKNVSNLKIIFKVPYIFFDKEYYLIYALMDILTIDLNSIILKKLRAIEGLIYDLEGSMELDELDKNLSIIMFSTSVSSLKLLNVINFILEILNNITHNDIDNNYIKQYIESIKIYKQKKKYQKNPEKIINEYSKYLLWNKKIVTEVEEFKAFSNINKNSLKEIANSIFNLNNIIICYDNKKNIDNEINKLLKKYSL
jgi:predicted Zn-dependent peptidase